MAKWKEVRNATYTSREVPFWGDCPRYEKSATLMMHLGGKQIGKTDLQPTFSVVNFNCSLLEGNNQKSASCKLDCPLKQKYLESHDF